jgi:hypothetical protein
MSEKKISAKENDRPAPRKERKKNRQTEEMVQISLVLPASMVKDLDALSGQTYCNRTALIKIAIKHLLDNGAHVTGLYLSDHTSDSPKE